MASLPKVLSRPRLGELAGRFSIACFGSVSSIFSASKSS
jgi:hypothetical protein